jgi:hypothetical protein
MRLRALALLVIAAFAAASASAQDHAATQLRERVTALDALYAKRDLDAVIPLGESLLPEARAGLGLRDDDTYLVAQRLASAKRDAGRNEEALGLAREWTALAEQHLGPDSGFALRLRLTVGTILYEQGQWREAASGHPAGGRLRNRVGVARIRPRQRPDRAVRMRNRPRSAARWRGRDRPSVRTVRRGQSQRRDDAVEGR